MPVSVHFRISSQGFSSEINQAVIIPQCLQAGCEYYKDQRQQDSYEFIFADELKEKGKKGIQDQKGQYFHKEPKELHLQVKVVIAF